MSKALGPRAETFLHLARRYADTPWLQPAIALLDGAMEQDGGHDYGHLLRVLANARRIFDGEVSPSAQISDMDVIDPSAQSAEICHITQTHQSTHSDVNSQNEHTPQTAHADWNVVAAAVLFHDVVNLPKNHPERHLTSQRASEAAMALLQTCPHFPAALVPAVGEAIRVHSFSSGLRAQTLDAQIVTDADRLESLGAFGIARTFYVSGALGRSICDLADPFAARRPLDDREFGVDHFYCKLLKLRDGLYTRTARAMADTRHALMEAFLAGLREELP